jgi:hypothetical protein
MKEKLHRIRYMLNNLAYYTFDENSSDQKAVLQEALSEVDNIIKQLDKQFELEGILCD